MNRTEYWKNFKLGKELDIAGRFIYNGLFNFHEMEVFSYEEEIFEFLYNISVGIERLLKISVVLIEHDDSKDQKEFEKTLITHNHGELLKRVIAQRSVNLSGIHNEFLSLLTKFYKTYRYGRYDLEAMAVEDKEKLEFIKFLEKHLSIEVDTDTLFLITRNDQKIKKFIGKIVGKIAGELYDLICKEAGRLNIYTYEIRYGTKAFKIFIGKEYDFNKEDTLWKELLIYFIHSDGEGDQSKFMKSMTPLPFDPALESDYIDCFRSNIKKINVMDELESLYEDQVEDFKDRSGMLDAIGSGHLYYDPEEE